MSLIRYLRRIVPADITSFRRFTGAIVFFLTAAVVSLFDAGSDLQYILVFTFLFAGVLFVDISLLCDIRGFSRKYRLFTYGFGLALAGVLFLYMAGERNIVYTMRFALAFTALLAFLPVIAARLEGEKSLWKTIVALSRRSVTAGFFAFLVFAGLSLAVAGITTLFEISTSGIVYFKIWLVCALFYGPVLFLTTFPQADDPDRPDPGDRIVSVLVLYIFLPLIVFYLLISYAYILRIIIVWEMPQGVAGPLSLGFALAAVWFRMLFFPYRDRNRFYSRLYMFLPHSIFPLFVLLGVSIGMRISQHGITEGRYLVVAAGLWLLMVVIRSLFYKEFPARFLFISLGIMALFSLIGPWSVHSVSRSSQARRLVDRLERGGYVRKGRIVPRQGRAHIDIMETVSIASYLGKRGWLSALTNRFAIKKEFTSRMLYRIMVEDRSENSEKSHSMYSRKRVPVRTTGYDWMFRFNVPWHAGRMVTVSITGDCRLQFDRNRNRIRLYRGGRILLDGDFHPFLVHYHNELGKRDSLNFLPGRNHIMLRQGRYRVMLVLEKLSYVSYGKSGKIFFKDVTFRSEAFIGL